MFAKKAFKATKGKSKKRKNNAHDYSWSGYKVNVHHAKLILIVGSYENASAAEVEEAS